MATFNINKTYSATYSYKKVATGWECAGTILKNGKATKIEFVGRGKTQSTAVNNAHRKAERICPIGQ
jgi:hypothetical protein